MAKLAHYSVIEICEDNEVLNVGTFTNITSNKIGLNLLNENIQKALCDHLDCEEDDIKLMPYLTDLNAFFSVVVFGCVHNFSIDETWLY